MTTRVSVEDLVVTLEVLGGDGSVVATEDLSVPLLGHGATADGAFWIDRDPAAHELAFDISSYRVP